MSLLSRKVCTVNHLQIPKVHRLVSWSDYLRSCKMSVSQKDGENLSKDGLTYDSISSDLAFNSKYIRSIGGKRRDTIYILCCALCFHRYHPCLVFHVSPIIYVHKLQKDRERSTYGLKEKNLAKTYIKLIPLGMRDPDAIRLLNWKKPTERSVRMPSKL